MTFTDAIKTCFSKYFTFSGRASRSEYWYFWLFVMLGSILLAVLNSALFGPTTELFQELVVAEDGTESTRLTRRQSYNSGIFGSLFALIVFVPGVTVACRRLHDVGKSGWWILLPFATTTVAALGSIILTVGWSTFVETMSTTGRIRVENPTGSLLALLLCLGTFILLLVWLLRASVRGSNKYGPNPFNSQLPDTNSEVFR